jgi:hypothetical protein
MAVLTMPSVDVNVVIHMDVVDCKKARSKKLVPGIAHTSYGIIPDSVARTASTVGPILTFALNAQLAQYIVPPCDENSNRVLPITSSFGAYPSPKQEVETICQVPVSY